MQITMGTYALVRKRTDNRFRFCSLNYPDQGVLELPSVGAGLEEGTWMGQLSKGNDLYIDEERGARGLRNGSAVLWRYSKRSGDWLFCFVGSGDRTDHQRPDGDQDLSMIDLALFARLAENEYIGMSSGIMGSFCHCHG